mgnify:CR=1 FL=1
MNKKKEQQVKIMIQKELRYLGYNPKYYGTKYMMDAIFILYCYGNDIDNNLSKYVYPIISKKYNKTMQNIRCNMINATDLMILECEEIRLMRYLKYFNYSKPGPKKIIEAVLNRINKKYL